MDRNFMAYYEDELAHIRELATEFAAVHPTVARNLSLDAVPCPDPYVERLLEGVAYLAARTRLKVDAESSRYVRNLLDELYPDLVCPAPAMTMAVLHPGPQVQTMLDGHRVQRGTRFVAAYREGISTRATYTSTQEVALWPIALDKAEYLQDRGAMNAAGLDRPEAEAAIRLTLSRVGPGSLAELSLDRLDLWFVGGSRGGVIFDAVFGHGSAAIARSAKGSAHPLTGPSLVGVTDREGLLPRVRPSFEGYRLMREYFLMPDRFHFLRLDGLNPALRACTQGSCEVVIYLDAARPEISDIAAKDFRLFVTPLVNLFEKECNVIDIDGRSAAHVVHADRTRPRDFEIYRLTNVEDADSDGPEALVEPLYSVGQHRGSGLVYTTERRPRRPGEDEIRRGQTRTNYTGDDLFLSVARPADVTVTKALRRLDIRALCTNRDLPILDDSPKLSLETGDPVGRVELLSPFRRPRGSVASALPNIVSGGESQLDDLAWRLVAQLSLNHLSLAEPGLEAEPLRAMLDLYAGRGDPALSRHARSITRVRSRQVVERLGIPGPICFGHGIEVTLDVDETTMTGASTLLLSALLNQLFARHAAINSFVRTKTHLMQRQEDVSWPMSPGNRALI
ncbi:type VI secretion system baseplate subunit TssF [Tabrizicola sp.]|uniref:type VI secretion system baseplate subunit TssF n=1 Tax=Tabrizicola sp. TaxID=2005166 RepID=UPI001A4744EF|nr:type VI secretion system baseplate subunit TssF [Tabrizicola sp.]MBL9063808.1 type VI secretion system baseplate subunit TssF [Tabrizicola sp.]